MEKFGETRGGVEAQNALRYRKSYYGGPIGSHQHSFEWYYPRPPMTSSSPRLGFTTRTKNPITVISGMAKATHFKFSMHVHRVDYLQFIAVMYAQSSLQVVLNCEDFYLNHSVYNRLSNSVKIII